MIAKGIKAHGVGGQTLHAWVVGGYPLGSSRYPPKGQYKSSTIYDQR